MFEAFCVSAVEVVIQVFFSLYVDLRSSRRAASA